DGGRPERPVRRRPADAELIAGGGPRSPQFGAAGSGTSPMHHSMVASSVPRLRAAAALVPPELPARRLAVAFSIKRQEGRDLTRFDLDFDLPEQFQRESLLVAATVAGREKRWAGCPTGV